VAPRKRDTHKEKSREEERRKEHEAEIIHPCRLFRHYNKKYTYFFMDTENCPEKLRKQVDNIMSQLTVKDKEFQGDYPNLSYKIIPFVEKIDLTWKCLEDDPLKDLVLILIEYFKLQKESDSKQSTPTKSPLKRYRADE
jgi:hypothetical protein